MYFPPQPRSNKFYLKKPSLENILYEDNGNTPDDNRERRQKERNAVIINN